MPLLSSSALGKIDPVSAWLQNLPTPCPLHCIRSAFVLYLVLRQYCIWLQYTSTYLPHGYLGRGEDQDCKGQAGCLRRSMRQAAVCSVTKGWTQVKGRSTHAWSGHSWRLLSCPVFLPCSVRFCFTCAQGRACPLPQLLMVLILSPEQLHLLVY